MTTEQRLERQLPAILEELYLGRTPDYRDEVLAAAVRTRQRPWWTFPGRWLPMADIASRPALAPRLPWRVLAVATLLIALLLAALALVAGSRQTRVPPPFGLAGNGRIAYVSNGDVFVLDPTSGVTTAVTAGPAAEDQPVFSPDGTRLAFRRSNTSNGSPAEDIVVANADGSDPIVITTTPLVDRPNGLEWAPDSRSLLVGAPIVGEVRLYDATRAASPRVVAREAFFGSLPFRPPDGGIVMLGRPTKVDGADVREWFTVDLATGAETPLVVARDPSIPRWSPDGSRVVYADTVPAGTDTHLLFIVNADGSDAHRVTNEPATWAEVDPAWSPDGTRIAFNHAELVDGQWVARPTGIATVATGTVDSVGPLARDVRAANPGPGDGYAGGEETYSLEWSPDGRWLLALGLDAEGHPVLIDTTSGDDQVLDVITTTRAWQRIAP